MDFEGSRTQANLMAAFAGESQARNKYTYYAEKAKQDGYEQIAAIFTETANNEMAHAKIWFKQLHSNSIPATAENLADAAAGENYEWTQMYKEFEQVATEEGFTEIAALFKLVGGIESEHEKRFQTLRTNLEQGIVFARTGVKVWMCRNCGHLHTGKEAPAICPVCSYPRAFFEIKAE